VRWENTAKQGGKEEQPVSASQIVRERGWLVWLSCVITDKKKCVWASWKGADSCLVTSIIPHIHGSI
jgi:hypothetical protein